MVAVRRANAPRGKSKSPGQEIITQEQAAQEMNVTPQQITMAKIIEEWQTKRVRHRTVIARRGGKNGWNQAASLSAEIANLPNGVRADSVSQEQAAKQLGTTPKAISQARTIREGAPGGRGSGCPAASDGAGGGGGFSSQMQTLFHEPISDLSADY
jgi:hypothetical protein